MKANYLLLVAVGITAIASVNADAIRDDFESGVAGSMPKAWKSDKTGTGPGSIWKIALDRTAPRGDKVLAQTAVSPNATFNVCVYEGARFQDVAASVAIKPVAGKLDQGGGLVWRYKDANNYYICRLNPLEENLRVYKVVAGKRIQLGTKEELKLPEKKWCRIDITMKGDAITCSLDDRQLLTASDATFKDAGLVGLWTKADAQTYFDDFRACEMAK